jgi:hypothetical protein
MTMKMQNLVKRFWPDPGAALERRLHRRALMYWWRARGGHDLVVLSSFDPLEIEDDFSHGFLLDLRPDEPMLAYSGPVLAQEAGLEAEQVPLASIKPDSLLMRFAHHHARAVVSGEPETAEYDFVTYAGYHVLCRGALLPLSSDGDRIDHVYGVVSWKSEKLPQPGS